jgi:hypothetical protein
MRFLEFFTPNTPVPNLIDTTDLAKLRERLTAIEANVVAR